MKEVNDSLWKRADEITAIVSQGLNSPLYLTDLHSEALFSELEKFTCLTGKCQTFSLFLHLTSPLCVCRSWESSSLF